MTALPSAPKYPAAPPPPYEETMEVNNSAPYPYPVPGQGATPGVKWEQAHPYPTQPHVAQPGPVAGPHAIPVQTVYIQSPLVFHDHPVQMCCPSCNRMIMTQLTHHAGTLAWLSCGALCLLGCWIGCCFIPFCVNALLDVDHHCPNCHALLGTYCRL